MQHVLRRIAGKVKISQFLMARYAEEVAQDPDQPMGELIRTLYAEQYQKLLDDEQLEEICGRIIEHGERLAKATEEAKPARVSPAQGQLRGQYMADHLSKMDATSTCLWLANFDAREAQRLYMDEDYELVETMAQVRRLHEQEASRLEFENALFGFGGSYGKGKGPAARDEGEVRVHDLSGLTSQQALDRIAAMGRRQ